MAQSSDVVLQKNKPLSCKIFVRITFFRQQFANEEEFVRLKCN